MGCLKLTYRETYPTFKVVKGGLYASENNAQRFWNVDPVVVPHLSNYHAFENNPILLSDEKGNSADVKKDEKSKTITVTATIYLYGDEVGKDKIEKAKETAQKSFDNLVNNKSFSSNGYNVKFNIVVKVVSNEQAEQLAKNNTDASANFVKIADASATSWNMKSGNVGIWTTRDILGPGNNPTTVVHEFFHSLGLDHEKDNKGKEKTIYETPRIIAPRGHKYKKQDGSLAVIKGHERYVTDKDISEVVENANNYTMNNYLYNQYYNASDKNKPKSPGKVPYNYVEIQKTHINSYDDFIREATRWKNW